MKVITIVSADRITPTMFVDFYRTLYTGNKVELIKDISCLYSKEHQTKVFEGVIEGMTENNVFLVRYSIKRTTVLDLPEAILEGSDMVIKFDLYSYVPEVLKSCEEGETVLERWKKNIEKIDGRPLT